MKRISVREYSVSELTRYLEGKGAENAGEIVSALANEGWVDDLRYARVIARHQAARDKGPTYVWAKLRQKGVSLALAEVKSIYNECAPQEKSELDLARRVVERRYPKALTDRATARKAFLALLRRGFSKEIAAKAVSNR